MLKTLASLSSIVTLFYALMFGVSLLIAWWRGYLHTWFLSEALFVDFGIGLAVGGVTVGLSRLGLRIRQVKALADEFSALLGKLTQRHVLLFAITSGVGEEALFRGVLQTEFGLPVATGLFAALHVGPSRKYLWWTGFALIVGLALGALCQWRGNLVGAIVAHATVNLLNLRYLSSREEASADSFS